LIPLETIPPEAIISLNGAVLLSALAIATLSSLLFGLAPALHSARLELNQCLKGTIGASRGSLQNLLVVSEVALSLTLLVGAGLTIRTFFALRQVTLGFEPDHVWTARIPLPDQRYAKAAQKARFFGELLPKIEALPGVLSAAETCCLPPYGAIPTAFEIAGPPRERGRGLFDLVSERYFDTLGIRLLQGRTFNRNEVADARKVMVVSQTMARENFGSENPIGRDVKLTFLERTTDPVKDPWFRIVGVVVDIKNQGLQQPSKPQVYIPYTISGFASRGIFVRTAGDPRALLPAGRREIAAIDPNLALDSSGLGQPGSMRDLLTSFSFSQPRFTVVLLTLFATVGLTLACIGVYSVISYMVTRRTREMGIRMALGAGSGHVIRIVLGTGLRLLACGTVSGLLLSFTVTRLLKTQIWGVPDHDSPTLITVALLMIVVGLAACYLPARRASRVDPAIALRHE
jgi:putative ABC transport system permease protein